MGVFPLGISDVVQFFGSIIELIGVLLIVCGVLCASFNALISYKRKSDSLLIYNRLKTSIARTLLLGLEILVAADVIRTVVLQPSLVNLEGLALLILIRTILSWALIVEIEERWPWNKKS